MPNTIALIAHDTCKDDLVSYVSTHAPTLIRYQLIATATTGERIISATGVPVEQKLTGYLGGVVQIAAEVAAGNVLAVIFLVDPSWRFVLNPVWIPYSIFVRFITWRSPLI